MKKILNMVKESFKGSNGKIDHKRLTVFAFVFMFAFTLAVILFREKEIPNTVLVEYAMVTITTVIVGGMGLTKLPNKTKIKEEIENADK